MEKIRSCFVACRDNDVAAVRRALEDGFVVDSHDGFNNTLLHESARHGRTEIVLLLLEHKADVHVQNKDGETPLHESAWFRHKEIVSLLLANMDNVNVKNNRGYTPLHFGAAYGHKEIISMLLSKKAKVNVRDKYGRTPLHYSAECGHTEIVSLLLENKADVNVKDDEGLSPLNYADDNKQVADVLLKHGAVRYKQSFMGHLASRLKFRERSLTSTTTTRSVKVTVTPGVEDNTDKSASTSFSHTQTIEIKDEVTNTIRNDETISDPAQIYENIDQHKIISGSQTITTSERGQDLVSAIAGCMEQAVTDCLNKFPEISSTCKPSISSDVSISQQNGVAPIVNITNNVAINYNITIEGGENIAVNGTQNVYNNSTKAITDNKQK